MPMKNKELSPSYSYMHINIKPRGFPFQKVIQMEADSKAFP